MGWSNEQKQALLEALTALAEVYGRTFSGAALRLYLQVLEKHSFESVMRALGAYVENATGQASYYPKPGDIIALIEGNPDDLTERAWQTVKEAIGRIGGYESVRFRDPLINAAVQQMGGWVHLCMDVATDAKRLEFASHEFRRLYRGYLQTRRAPTVSHLPGATEIDNMAHGYEDAVPPPVEIGQPLPEGLQARLMLESQAQLDRKMRRVVDGILESATTPDPEMPSERTERGQISTQRRG